MAFGLITPPVGTCLFLCSGIARVSVTKVIALTVPLLGAMLLMLLLIVYSPAIVTWLPSRIN
ncbi:MAG: TRAP transporter large permease subunit [Advenella sp.]|uniref:TRAP transporter large permease subunit n=1 Tax=Advenella sp. S44 TaxID=1982755 RepID=UPI00129086E5